MIRTHIQNLVSIIERGDIRETSEGQFFPIDK
jgi:hypothetical protein